MQTNDGADIADASIRAALSPIIVAGVWDRTRDRNHPLTGYQASMGGRQEPGRGTEFRFPPRFDT